MALKGGRGSGESRKSGHSGESDAGVVRQANVFIRWEGNINGMGLPYSFLRRRCYHCRCCICSVFNIPTLCLLT